MSTLEDELRCAVEDAIVGQPLRAGLAGRAQSAAMGVLVRHNIRGGQVRVSQQGAGFAVEVLLPPGPQRVRHIVLRFGGM